MKNLTGRFKHLYRTFYKRIWLISLF